jgi:hypothetical protein
MRDAKSKAHEMSEQSSMRRDLDELRGLLVVAETNARLMRERVEDLSDRLRAMEVRTMEA